MAFFSGLVILALMVSAEGGVGPSTNLSFCTESKECLEYELVCKTDEYEVRRYSPTRWVSTDAEAYITGVGAMAMAFRRLFQYITGANDGGVVMEMTAPVLVRMPEDTRVWEPAVYTLSFLLPSAYQERAPLPTNEKLYFTDMPHVCVYVRGYGGWMLSATSRGHARLLAQELRRVQAPHNLTYHYGVGYDSPLKLLNRHNEVWYVAEGNPVCTDPQEPTPAHTHTPPSSDTPTHTPPPSSDTPTHTPPPSSDTPTHTPPSSSDTPTHTPPPSSDTPTHTPSSSDTPTHTPPPSDTPTHTPPSSDTPTHTPPASPPHSPSPSPPSPSPSSSSSLPPPPGNVNGTAPSSNATAEADSSPDA